MRASSCFRPAELGGCSVASEVFNAASEARRFSFFEKRWGRSALRGAVLRALVTARGLGAGKGGGCCRREARTIDREYRRFGFASGWVAGVGTSFHGEFGV
jgi:hypothetical protein